jgi:hypothetical protein
LGVHGRIPDPLAGQGKILGIRSKEQTVGIHLKDTGNLSTVIYQFAVGLVGKQINGLIPFFPNIFEKITELF